MTTATVQSKQTNSPPALDATYPRTHRTNFVRISNSMESHAVPIQNVLPDTAPMAFAVKQAIALGNADLATKPKPVENQDAVL